MKDRSEHILNVESAIARTQKAISQQKIVLAGLENKLEAQRSELHYQRMMERFDKIDGLRQQVSDLVAEQARTANIASCLANGIQPD
jgi:hypothetical protein